MLLNKLLCAEIRLTSPLCKELSYLHWEYSRQKKTQNVFVPHQQLPCGAIYKPESRPRESITFSRSPSGIFLEVQAGVLPSWAAKLHHFTTMPHACSAHSCSSNCEQGTHYSIFGVWILEVVTQVIFTERIQFTE